MLIFRDAAVAKNHHRSLIYENVLEIRGGRRLQ